jgi:hypothetical protein
MADFTLTTGSDTVTGTESNDTVSGTAATLNSGDSDRRCGHRGLGRLKPVFKTSVIA